MFNELFLFFSKIFPFSSQGEASHVVKNVVLEEENKMEFFIYQSESLECPKVLDTVLFV